MGKKKTVNSDEEAMFGEVTESVEEPTEKPKKGVPNAKKFTKENAKEMGRKGGVKSGETKRARRTAREAAQRLLAMAATGKMKHNLIDLGYDPKSVDGIDNIDVIVARLFVQASAGDLAASDRLVKIAGYDCEENRAERESIEANIRRTMELQAKIAALNSKGGEDPALSVNLSDEDGNNDVVIYMPQMMTEEECQLPPEEPTQPEATAE